MRSRGAPLAGFEPGLTAKASRPCGDSPEGGNQLSRRDDRHVRLGQVIYAQSGIPKSRALTYAANPVTVAVGQERIVAHQTRPRPLGLAPALVAVGPATHGQIISALAMLVDPAAIKLGVVQREGVGDVVDVVAAPAIPPQPPAGGTAFADRAEMGRPEQHRVGSWGV